MKIRSRKGFLLFCFVGIVVVQLKNGWNALNGHVDAVIGGANESSSSSSLSSSLSLSSSSSLSSLSHRPSSALQCYAKLQYARRSELQNEINHDVPLAMSIIKIKNINHVHLHVNMYHLTDIRAWSNKRWLCMDRQGSVTQGVVTTKSNRRTEGNIIIVRCSDKDIHTLTAMAREQNVTLYDYDLVDMQYCENMQQYQTFRQANKTIAMSTMIAGQKSRAQLKEWIAYHHLIGFQHFFIYLNEAYNLTGLPQEPYIDYVPYDYSLRYFHPRNNQTARFGGWIQLFGFQTAEMNDSLYRAKAAGLEWIAMMDVDEYLHVTKNSTASTPIQALLDGQTRTVKMNNIWFYDKSKDAEMAIDWVWRSPGQLSAAKLQREKNIHKVDAVSAVGVHYVFMGPQPKNLVPETEAYLRHFKSTKSTPPKHLLVEDASLRDTFRAQLVAALERTTETENMESDHTVNMIGAGKDKNMRFECRFHDLFLSTQPCLQDAHTDNLKRDHKTGSAKQNTSSGGTVEEDIAVNQTAVIPILNANNTLQEAKDDIIFFHIGKTAGSTMRCLFRSRLQDPNCRKDDRLRTLAGDDTAFQRRVVGFVHVGARQTTVHPLASQFKYVLTSLRNPVDRLVSWFNYERKRTQHPVFSCFETIGDLVETTFMNATILSNRAQLSLDECRALGRGCIGGQQRCKEHNFFNYRFYLGFIQKQPSTRPILLSARTEHLWQDLDDIHVLLGGRNLFLANRATSFSLRISDANSKTVSDTGRVELCRYVCSELNIYVYALFASANLDATQRQESMRELEESCGVNSLYDLCNFTI